jgi:hypothetical protein
VEVGATGEVEEEVRRWSCVGYDDGAACDRSQYFPWAGVMFCVRVDEEKRQEKIRTRPTNAGHASSFVRTDRSDRTSHNPEVAISAASGGYEAFSLLHMVSGLLLLHMVREVGIF